MCTNAILLFIFYEFTVLHIIEMNLTHYIQCVACVCVWGGAMSTPPRGGPGQHL